MNEFETELDLAGETRPVRIYWDSVWGDLCIDRVELALEINESYTGLGAYAPHTVRRWTDITPIVSEDQALALVKQIRAACAKARAEDYDDGKMQDWEEKNRRLLAA